MKFFICLAFIAVAVAGVFGDEKCFDKDKAMEDMGADFEECGYTKDASKEDKIKAYGCVMKKKGAMDDDNKIVCDEFKNMKSPYIISNKDKIMEVIDKCCEGGNPEAHAFFDCLKPELKEICPNDKCETEE